MGLDEVAGAEDVGLRGEKRLTFCGGGGSGISERIVGG
jgi:hypothetical protein